MTDQTRSRVAVGLGAILLVLWGLVVCAGQGRAGTLNATSATHWPIARFSVSGIELPGVPVQLDQADGSVLISLDVPALNPHAAISLRVQAGDGTWVEATLPDGSPGPLYSYRSLACQADLNADGGVGLDDVSITFGQVLRGSSCP